MRTATVCAVLAAGAWLVSLRSSQPDAAMVFATVWTAMAVAYFGRELRRRVGGIKC